MRKLVAWIATGPLLVAPLTPAAAAPYTRAAEIRRACSATFAKNPIKRTVDDVIEQYSKGPIEEVRAEAYQWMERGYRPAVDCVLDQLAAHAKNRASASQTVPALRPTAKLEAHNPANEASQCLELITKKDFERRGVKNITGAVFNNRCAYPVETRWCIGADRCARLGYDNLATMPASHYRGISYDAKPGVKTDTRWAGCRLGFAHRPDFAGTLHYACK